MSTRLPVQLRGASYAALALILSAIALPAAGDGHGEPPAAPDRAHTIVEAYKERFRVVDDSVTQDLEALYADDVVLEDPIVRLEGLASVRRYFEDFAERSAGARFEMNGEVVGPGQAAVFWTMVFPGKDGEDGRRVDGVSHLEFDDKIRRQRDYFDLGEAVYSQVPVLGWLTGLVDSRLKPERAEPESD